MNFIYSVVWNQSVAWSYRHADRTFASLVEARAWICSEIPQAVARRGLWWREDALDPDTTYGVPTRLDADTDQVRFKWLVRVDRVVVTVNS